MSVSRSSLVFVMALLAGGAAAKAVAASPNDLLPEAPAKAIIVRACTTCHQAPQIVSKHHTEDEWDSLVGRMVDRGARATDSEQDQIIAYLTKYFGPGKDPAAAAKPTPAEASPQNVSAAPKKAIRK